MAVFQSIRNLFIPQTSVGNDAVVAAPPTEYKLRPLTSVNVKELLRLNLRCFTNGDSYNKHTFNYLLNDPMTLGYRAVTEEGETVAFVFAMINSNGAAHLTTIGVAPEHRRRGIAQRLLGHLQLVLKEKGVGTIMLEVRVSNWGAQELYSRAGFTVVQRINNYYNNGEDCYLMIRSIA